MTKFVIDKLRGGFITYRERIPSMPTRRIKKPRLKATSQALDQLVAQFSQPLAFLRELVQNSLDAATEIVEIEVGYDQEADCCFVRVRDTGFGMDRNIIDTKLTRLFSSTKDDDFTKIGKFGIGFVSIFAVKPKLVVLETGRDGESWRLLFKPDRSFERRELKAPVEGTCVTVFVPKGKDELPQLQTDCHDTVAFWCRHCEVEILFNGKSINLPFELPEVKFSHRRAVEGTEVVVAPCLEPIGFHGYYNRGLTLLEGEGSPLPHISFKLRSRYLEHTLSRDNILFDEHYEKAMVEVKRAAYQELPQAFLDHLSRRDEPELWSLARVLWKYRDPAPEAFFEAAIFPSRRRRLKLRELDEKVLVHPMVDEFWMTVEAAGYDIVLAEKGDQKTALLADMGKERLSLDATFLFFTVLEGLSASETALLEEFQKIDRSLRRLVLLEGKNIPSSWEGRFCGYVLPEMKVASIPCPTSLEPGHAIGIFKAHPFWEKLVALYDVHPELALSLGSRKLSLDLGLSTDRDGKLFGRLVRNLKVRAEKA